MRARANGYWYRRTASVVLQRKRARVMNTCASESTSGGKVQFELADGSIKTVDVQPEETVLEACKRYEDVPLQSDCEMGVCMTCTAEVVEQSFEGALQSDPTVLSANTDAAIQTCSTYVQVPEGGRKDDVVATLKPTTSEELTEKYDIHFA